MLRNISLSFPLKYTLLQVFTSFLLLSALNATYPIPNFDLSSTSLDPAKAGFTIKTNSVTGGNFGWAVSKAGDIDNDGYDDILIGAFSSSSDKGVVYVIYGGPSSSFSDFNLLTTTSLNPVTTGFTITGPTNSQLGTSAGTAGDVNNDGYDDIIIGAPKQNSYQGAVYVIYGRQRTSFGHMDLGSTTLNPLTTGFTILGNALGDYLGYFVGTAGDINNDDYDDIIIGANGKNSAQGAAYVIYGGPKSPSLNIDLSLFSLNHLTTGFSISQSNAGANLGRWVSTAGDINNDDFDDIIVGAYGGNAAYVIYGGPKSSLLDLDLSSTALNPTTTGFTLSSTTSGDNLGTSVSTAGDIDNDGYDDLIVGAFGNNNGRGIAYVIYGGPKPSLPDRILSSLTPLNTATVGFTIKGNADGDSLGFPVSSAGDINNDGYSDIIIGASGKNVGQGANQGAVYVIYGGPRSSRSNINLSSGPLDPATTGFTIIGNAPSDQLGACVSSAGDINNDGFDDIIIGAHGKGSYQGIAYVIYSTCVTPHCSSCNSRTCQTCDLGYGLSASSLCETCPYQCHKCTDPSICEQCTSPFILYQSWCFPACPTRSFSNNGKCQECPLSCSSCTSQNSCQTCDQGYVLNNSLCALPCSARTYNSSGTCKDCPPFCIACTSQSACQTCDQGYVLSNSLCALPCSSRTYNSSGTCINCPPGCSACTSQSSCQTCDPGYVISNSLCALPCSARTYNSSGICIDCPSFCRTCTSQNSCQTCDQGYVISNSLCALPCSSRTYNSSGTCINCPPGCSACTSLQSCQTCDPGYMKSNSLCVLPPPSTLPPTTPTTSTPSAPSYPDKEATAAQAIASGVRGISSAVNIGSAASPLTALVSKIVQNTRYLNLSVTDELALIYQSWETELISWGVPNLITKFDHFQRSPEVFARYELDSSFLANFWATLMTIVLSLVILAAFYVIKKLFEGAKYDGWVSNLVLKLVAGSFNFALVQAYGCFDDIIFYLILDFKTNPFNTFFCWASFFSAVGFLALGCFLVFFNIWKVRQYQRIKQNTTDVEAFNERNKRWELFYSDFNDDDLFSQSTLAVLVVRSSLSSTLTTTLYEYPLMQTASFIILDGAIILFLHFKNPFATLRGRLAQYYFEAITLLVHLCTFMLAMQDTFPRSSSWLRKVLSTGIIYLNTALISGSLGFLFIETYKTISQKNRTKLKQSQDVMKQEDTMEAQSILSHPQLAPNLDTENKLNSQNNSRFLLQSSNNFDLSMNADDPILPRIKTNPRTNQQRGHSILPLVQNRHQPPPQKKQPPYNSIRKPGSD